MAILTLNWGYNNGIGHSNWSAVSWEEGLELEHRELELGEAPATYRELETTIFWIRTTERLETD